MAHTNAALNANSTNIISQIQLPNNGGLYEIHDAGAIHSVEELGLSAALVFKGVKASTDDLPSSAKTGDVWHVTADDCEYVFTDTNEWEALGNVHDAASSTHTHNVNVTGTLKNTAVTGTVAVPTVSTTQKYLTASAEAPTVTPTANKGVLGSGATFSGSATASTKKLAVSSVTQVTGNSDVSVPVISSNANAVASKASGGSNGTKGTKGTAASWGASVSNGVLSFSWKANTPTTPTTPTTLPTFTDVTATKTVLGKAVTASKVTTGSKTVATGSLSDSGDGASVATGVSSVTVSVASKDEVKPLMSVAVSAPNVKINAGTSTSANAVQVTQVTTGSGTANLTNGKVTSGAITGSGTTQEPIG